MEPGHGTLRESDRTTPDERTSRKGVELDRREANGKDGVGALAALLLPLCCVLPLLLVALVAWLASLLGS